MTEPKLLCCDYVIEFDLVHIADIGTGEERYELTQRISFEMENVSAEEVPYNSGYQFVDDESAPAEGKFTILAPGYDLADTITATPSTKRKKVLDIRAPEIKLAPGAKAKVTWELTGHEEAECRTYISFGMVTEGVTIKANTPDYIEFFVDPIQGADVVNPGEWIFNRRFLVEQHIPFGWAKKEDGGPSA